VSRAPDPILVRQWTDEVAGDPRSLAFLPLAGLYHRSGRRDAALRLCLRGLAHYPENVEAHCLLGDLYRAGGDLDKAFDEWDIALHLDPAHIAARRNIGLLCLQREEWERARRHLERAVADTPGDPALAAALQRATLAGAGADQGKPGRDATEAETAARPLPSLMTSLQQPVERFADAARARAVLLINARGKLLGQHGFSSSLDPIGVASLTAGIHASSRALANLLRQDGFDHLYQRGSKGQIFIGPFATPAEELILIAVLNEASVLGMVRISFTAFVREVAALPAWQDDRARVTADSFEQDLESGWAHLFGKSLAGVGSAAAAPRARPSSRFSASR
jgi:tetratricopeptide (TPR) repeat protein